MIRIAGAAALAVGLATSGCGKGKEAASETAAAEPIITVGRENIATVSVTELRSGPTISGSLQPVQEATARAEVSGTVKQTLVEAGQSVKRGQVLVRLDDVAVRDAYLSAKSAVRTAELSLENARRNAERTTRLTEVGALPERDLETARWTVTNAEGVLADARARLAAAEEQLGHTTVRAPFQGLVSDRPADAGDVVQIGTALVTVVNPTTLRLEASVPAHQIGRLRTGVPVEFTVTGFPRRVVGRVDRINPVVDPATRQVKIYATIPNADRALVGGLFAEGRVATETKRSIAVPVSAVDSRGVAPTVRRIRNGRVDQTQVELGVRDEVAELIEIQSGLAEGDTVLLGSALGVTPGVRVRVLEEEAGR